MAMRVIGLEISVLVIGALLIVPSWHCATQTQDSFISLFADSSRSYDAYCSFQGEQAIIELWIYCYPSIRGQSGAEFSIEYPSNVIPSAPISNDEIISFQSGDLSSGVNILYEDCQWNVHWCFHQFLILTAHDLTLTEIVPYRFRNCEPDYVHEPVKKWMDLYLNYEDNGEIPDRNCRPPLGIITNTEISSWGAIKTLLD